MNRQTFSAPMEGIPAPSWHTLEVNETFQALRSTVQGLSEEEARTRLADVGANELAEAEPINPLKILAGQFKSLIVWVLIIAGVTSGLLGETIDAVAILAIVVLNALVGFYQEYNAEKSLAALKKMTAPQAKVVRGGSAKAIPASQVAPGDVVLLEAGDLVPADLRIFDANSLACVEASLTGESEAVSKTTAKFFDKSLPLGDRTNMAFMSTVVATGSGKGVVTATGMRSEIGAIAGMLEAQTDEATPLQKRLETFGKLLVWASLGIVAVVFVLGLLRGIPAFELFLTSVTLAVAAVPEGLPAIVTVALALGVQRMARRRALIRKLPAVETLGSTNVICTDKTGTLTVGEMTVTQVATVDSHFEVTGEGYEPKGEVIKKDGPAGEATRLLHAFVACSNARLSREGATVRVVGDPTEGALITAGGKIGINPEAIDRESPRLRELPFDSDRKMMSVIRANDVGADAFIKGAPDVVLSRCTTVLTSDGIRPMTEAARIRILTDNDAMANRALRVLAAATRPIDKNASGPESVERDLTFLGLVGMYDPPRQEAKLAVAKCRSAGIRVIMITGDHPKTAIAIARELGIADQNSKVVTGVELNSTSDNDINQWLNSTAVFARVTAEHKLRVVKALKSTGAVVAMTGDGVNDAPAIKGADIGVAMGKSGTEVTKEASDLVVTDDNFVSIVAAVEEGRGIYDNIKKTLQYLLAGNTGELLLMTACVVVGLPMPLLPIHLLWINLVTDGLPALCLATDPIDPDVMKRTPRQKNAELADRGFLKLMGLTGLLTAAVSFAVYVYGLRYETLEMARTHAFAVLVFAELFRSFGCRSETKFVWEVGVLSNAKLAAVVALSFTFQLWSHHNSALGSILKTGAMEWGDCVMLVALAAIPLLTLEGVKWLNQQRVVRPLSLV